MKSHFVTIIKFLIGWPLAIVALYYIYTIVSPQTPEIIPHLHDMHFSLLLLGIFCFVGFYVTRGFIWFQILRYYSYEIPFRESLFLWAFSELKRYIPGNIWSFLGRSVLFHERGVAKNHLATSFVVEAQVFVLSGLLISLLTLSFVFKQYHIYGGSLISLLVVGVVVSVCLFFAGNKFVLPRLPGRMSRVLSHVLPPFSFRQNSSLLLISVLALLFFGIGNFFVASSLFLLPVNLVWMISGFFVLAFIAGYLSIIAPTGLGVREGLIIILLKNFVNTGLAGFLSLFTRVILMGSEAIFLLSSYLLYRLRGSLLLSRFSTIFVRQKYLWYVLSAMFIFIGYFTAASFSRFDNFYTGRFDLGNMAQTVWNTLHGRFFLFSNPNGAGEISRLAFHADVFLVLLAPFYALWQSPKLLLLIQAVVVGAGAFFVYLIALKEIKNKQLAVLLSLAYLLNPALERATLYDFHAVTLATTLLLGTFYFMRTRRYVYFFLLAVLSGITKEQVWVIISFFGIYIAFIQKKYLLGVVTSLLSAFLFYLLVWQVIPHFLGSQHFALSYFSDFGDGPTSIVKNLFFSPVKILSIVFEKSRLLYLNQLLLPLGYLPLLSPFSLLFALPDMLINLLSSNAQLHQIYYQYTSTLTPFFLISTILAISWIERRLPPKLQIILPLYLVGCIVLGAYLYSPLPGAHGANLDMFIHPVVNSRTIDSYLTHIPEEESVTATNNLGSHITNRRYVYAVPVNMHKSDRVLFLLNNSNTQPSLPALSQMVLALKKDPRYKLDFKSGDFIAFRRISSQ